MEKKLLVGITGASGMPYTHHFIRELQNLKMPFEIIITEAGKLVWKYELEKDWQVLKDFALRVYEEHEISAPPASGSAPYYGMVIIPCSMGTLSAIACGSARNLLQRAADVMLKERKPLVLVVRETPLSLIHLKNMLSCTEAGATIFPAMPAFYHKPSSLEDLIIQFVKRIIQFLNLSSDSSLFWQGL